MSQEQGLNYDNLDTLKSKLVRLQDHARIEIIKLNRDLDEMGESSEIRKPSKVRDEETKAMKWSWEIITRDSIENKKELLGDTLRSLDDLMKDFSGNLQEIAVAMETLAQNIVIEPLDMRQYIIPKKNMPVEKLNPDKSQSKTVKQRVTYVRNRISEVGIPKKPVQPRNMKDVLDWLDLADNAEGPEEKEFSINQAKAAMSRIDPSKLNLENRKRYLTLESILYPKPKSIEEA